MTEEKKQFYQSQNTQNLLAIHKKQDTLLYSQSDLFIVEQILRERGLFQNNKIIKDSYFICKNCGHIGNREYFMKGHFLIEIFLWLIFLAPGIIYSIWRYVTQYPGCPKCKQDTMLSVTSPMGRKLLKDLG